MRQKTKRRLYRMRNVVLGLTLLALLWNVFLSLSGSHVSTYPTIDVEPATVIVDVQTCTKSLFSWCRLPDASWKRYEKDLLLGSSWLRKVFLVYKQVPESVLTEQDNVVVKLTVEPPTIKGRKLETPEWDLVDKKAGLWIKRARFENLESSVTAIKVLFGQGIRYPVPKWYPCAHAMLFGRDRYSMPSLFYRLGAPATIKKPKVELNAHGKLRIAQASDLHETTGHGECREVAPPTGEDEYGVCLGDKLTARFLSEAFLSEKPDLVVFSGDLIHGYKSPDPETALVKAVLPAMELQIPYTAIWGNHDAYTVPNYVLTNILMELPYSVMEHGPEDVFGDGNYVLNISPADQPEIPALSLYLMDTHSKNGPKPRNYDWVRKDQIEYFVNEGAANTLKLVDWDGYALSMAFLHIPTSHFLIFDPENRVGDMQEVPQVEDKDEGVMSALASIGVSVFLAGHDHVNDFCQFLYKKEELEINRDMYVCYAGGAGYAGYGGEPKNGFGLYQRRIRFFDVDIEQGSIDTYHRIDRSVGEIHRFTLVNKGKPIAPSHVTDSIEVRLDDLDYNSDRGSVMPVEVIADFRAGNSSMERIN